ncbi:response regulator transcription factor [Zooshikella harenae]|uniref:Response regulator transcription factor n=1 Tax=Zooshikella harenae TaxID=2827238 RepID=A0ABS5ZHA9_9GAMM|nr:response regulator transcription factor [Zooshikella harenae]MBU2712392.1 response regulator transcription factor [Zooshikella harenae]
MERTILVVDDDSHIRQVILFALKKAGMQAVEAADGQMALDVFTQTQPDLIILDINMPEYDGLEVCKAIRKVSEVPILFLSSRDDEVDRVVGLEIGGDDYVTKPFSPRELVARVNVILKRVHSAEVKRVIQESAKDDQARTEDTLSVGKLCLNVEKHLVFWGESQVKLTATEFAIMHTLIRYPEKVFDRDNIMNQAYSNNIHVSGRTIDSHIRHIRHKFQQLGCAMIIETVHSVGYKLGSCN